MALLSLHYLKNSHFCNKMVTHTNQKNAGVMVTENHPKTGTKLSLPTLRCSDNFCGWICVMASGFSFSAAPFLRFVTSLFSSTCLLPLGFSISSMGQPLLFSAAKSSQRADVGSPSCKKS